MVFKAAEISFVAVTKFDGDVIWLLLNRTVLTLLPSALATPYMGFRLGYFSFTVVTFQKAFLRPFVFHALPFETSVKLLEIHVGLVGFFLLGRLTYWADLIVAIQTTWRIVYCTDTKAPALYYISQPFLLAKTMA